MKQAKPFPLAHVNSTPPVAFRSEREHVVPELSPAELAHELNSHLDGSLRCLRLAIGTIESPAERCDAVLNVQRALHTLSNMAALLQRVMNKQALDINIFEQAQPLHEVVRACVDSLQPMLDGHSIRLHVDLTPRAQAIAAATLAPIIHNGLRNAIESCAAKPSGPREIELALVINQHDQLLILVSDTGIGLPHPIDQQRRSGRGFGLELSTRIACRLGGTLRLTNVPFGSGAILQVAIPVRSLEPHG